MADDVKEYLEKAKKDAGQMVTVKFFNMERKGEPHEWTSNGQRFGIKHNEVKQLPLHAVNALKDAVKVEWKMKDIEMGRTPEKYDEPRFMVEILSEERAKAVMPEDQRKQEQKQEDVVSDILKTQRSRD